MSAGPVLCAGCHQDCAVVSRYGHLCEKCHEALYPTPPQRMQWEMDREADFESKGGGLEASARYPGVGLSSAPLRLRELYGEEE